MSEQDSANENRGGSHGYEILLIARVCGVIALAVVVGWQVYDKFQDEPEPAETVEWDEARFDAAMTTLENRGFTRVATAGREAAKSTREGLLYSGNPADWLYETDWQAIAEAAETISNVDDLGDELRCLAAALSHEQELVRELACNALGTDDVVATMAKQPLLRMLQTDDSPELRRKAVRLLTGMGASAAANLGALLDADDRETRYFAALALASQASDGDNSAAADALRETLHDTDPDVRALAGAALLRTGDDQSGGVSQAIAGLTLKEQSVRRICAISLSSGDQQLVPHLDALIEQFGNDDPAVRRLVAIATIDTFPQAEQRLVDATKHTNPYLRFWAARSLTGRALADPAAAVAALIPLLSDNDTAVSSQAEKASVDVFLKDSTAYQAYREESYGIRGAAITAIGEIGTDSEAVIDALPALLSDEIWQVRLAAVNAIEGLDSKPAVKRALLSRVADDENEAVRERADALIQLIDERSTETP